MRCRAGLGQGPTALPANTPRGVPVVSAFLVPVHVAVRDRPLAVSKRLLWQQRGTADGQDPIVPTGQAVTGVALKAPPLLVTSPCFLLHSLMSILSKLNPRGPKELPQNNLSVFDGREYAAPDEQSQRRRLIAESVGDVE